MLTSLIGPAMIVPATLAAGVLAGSVFMLIPCCGGLFVLAVLGFWIWMLVDVCTKEFPENEKIVWVLVVVLANWIGAIIYFFVGRPKGR